MIKYIEKFFTWYANLYRDMRVDPKSFNRYY